MALTIEWQTTAERRPNMALKKLARWNRGTIQASACGGGDNKVVGACGSGDSKVAAACGSGDSKITAACGSGDK